MFVLFRQSAVADLSTWEEPSMDDYQEELLEARAGELDVPERDEDATEL
ncbi:hypothetical protein ACF8PU_18010 [Pseudomonas sp. GLN_6]